MAIRNPSPRFGSVGAFGSASRQSPTREGDHGTLPVPRGIGLTCRVVLILAAPCSACIVACCNSRKHTYISEFPDVVCI